MTKRDPKDKLTRFLEQHVFHPVLWELSLFHVALPPALLWVLRWFGYDRRTFLGRTTLTWTVLPLTYPAIQPQANTDWAFGPERAPQCRLPPPLYRTLEMTVPPMMVFLPMHVLLPRLVDRGRGRGRGWGG